MDGKILLFIRDYQLKRIALNCITQLNLPFVECFEADELSFKMQLFNNNNRLYIHEFMTIDDDKQFELIRSIISKGFKVLVIFPKYSIHYIDEGQKIGINDMLVHPVDVHTLSNKISSILSLPIEEIVVAPEEEEDSLGDIVSLEINRAQRGSYALSFVMIYLGSVTQIKQDNYFEALRVKLRETDIILHAREKNTHIIVCPFTPKEFLVEVENKVRTTFEEMKRNALITLGAKLYLHGLTFGLDGQSFESIYERLSISIHDNKLLEQSFVQKLRYGSSKLKAYKGIYKRI